MSKITVIVESASGCGGVRRERVEKTVELDSLTGDLDQYDDDESGQRYMNDERQAVGSLAMDVWEIWNKL